MFSRVSRWGASFVLIFTLSIGISISKAEAAELTPYCMTRYGGLYCPNEIYTGASNPLSPFSTFAAGDVLLIGKFHHPAFQQPLDLALTVASGNELFWQVGTRQGPNPNILYHTPCGQGDPVRGFVGNHYSRTLTPLTGATRPTHEFIECPNVQPLGGTRGDDFYGQPYNTTQPISTATWQFDNAL